MAVYLAFPVGMFHWFNQPKYFEEYVIKTKRELYPPENETYNKLYRDTVAEVRQREANKLLEELKEFKENQ